MMKRLALLPLLLLATPLLGQPIDAIVTGTFTNEEEVYFEGEAGRAPPPWSGLRLETDGGGLVWQSIDRFGNVIARANVEVTPAGWKIGDCTLAAQHSDDGAITFVPGERECTERALPLRLDPQGLTVRLVDGRQSRLLRARPFTCWLSVKRDKPKPDGGEDWLFRSGMETHDQGGRLRLGGGDTGAPEAIIRIRNVVWPQPSRNRPSLVLYVFTPDDMERAVAYSWADPGAIRIGINQRWMQASCSLAGSTLNGAE